MKIYMIVSRDEYELPEIVSDSLIEIARLTHWSVETIRSSFSRGRNPEKKEYKHYKHYVTVTIDDTERST